MKKIAETKKYVITWADDESETLVEMTANQAHNMRAVKIVKSITAIE